jgi:hypothetical protein
MTDLPFTSGTNPPEFQAWWEQFGSHLERLNREQLALAAYGSGHSSGADIFRSERDRWERIARETLWLRHGCPTHRLYGDDGELQCPNFAAHPGVWDFLRTPWDEIQMALVTGRRQPQPPTPEQQLLFDILTGDGQQTENMDEAFMKESIHEMVGDTDDVPLTVSRETVFKLIRAVKETHG